MRMRVFLCVILFLYALREKRSGGDAGRGVIEPIKQRGMCACRLICQRAFRHQRLIDRLRRADFGLRYDFIAFHRYDDDGAIRLHTLERDRFLVAGGSVRAAARFQLGNGFRKLIGRRA